MVLLSLTGTLFHHGLGAPCWPHGQAGPTCFFTKACPFVAGAERHAVSKGPPSLSPSTCTAAARKAQMRLLFYHHITPAPISWWRQQPSGHAASSFHQGRGQSCTLCSCGQVVPNGSRWHLPPRPHSCGAAVAKPQRSIFPGCFPSPSSTLACSRLADEAVIFSVIALKEALCRADPPAGLGCRQPAPGQKGRLPPDMCRLQGTPQSGDVGCRVQLVSTQSSTPPPPTEQTVWSAAAVNIIPSSTAPWHYSFINHHLSCRPASLRPDNLALVVWSYLFANIHQPHVPPCYFFQEIKAKHSLKLWI